MQTEAIIATLLTAAAFLKRPVQDVAAQSVKDVYEAVKYYLRKKFGEGSDGAKVLELALEKPESAMRKAVLAEEAAAAGLESDAELARVIAQLRALLPNDCRPGQEVRVGGNGNRVVVAGRDVIQTERHIQRSAITPDERHVTVEQREQIRAVIGELAVRLAAEDGKPNFAAGHRMLQRRFGVSSYLLLPGSRFTDAMRFLKEQRAIHRSRLRRQNPRAYSGDLHRAIFSRAREIGWDRESVYSFATSKFGLKREIVSLRALGPNQLKALAESLRRCNPQNSI